MFRLTVDCSELGRMKMDAELHQFKGNTATFVCKCRECRDNHIVTRKAPSGTMHIPKRVMHEGERKLVPIEGYPFSISVPAHMTHMAMDGFQLGHVFFRFKRKGVWDVVAVVPDKPLPDSWTVDIGDSYEVY